MKSDPTYTIGPGNHILVALLDLGLSPGVSHNNQKRQRERQRERQRRDGLEPKKRKENYKLSTTNLPLSGTRLYRP